MKHGLKNSKVVQNFTSVFSLASSFNQGWLRKGKSNLGSLIYASRSVRGLDEDRPRSFIDTYVGDVQSKDLIRLNSQSLDLSKPTIYDISPSNSLNISLYSVYFGVNGVKEEKPYLEVQGDDVESFRLDVSAVHGSFIGDTWFGGTSWSSDERYFVYVAKLKDEKKVSYFTSTAAAGGSEKSGELC